MRVFFVELDQRLQARDVRPSLHGAPTNLAHLPAPYITPISTHYRWWGTAENDFEAIQHAREWARKKAGSLKH